MANSLSAIYVHINTTRTLSKGCLQPQNLLYMQGHTYFNKLVSYVAIASFMMII